MPSRSTAGETLRRLRQKRGFSLARVAEQAGISVATLSRIETDKQGLAVDLLVILAGVLDITPADVLGSSHDGDDLSALSQRLANLRTAQRTQVFRDALRRGDGVPLETVLDNLASAIEALRDELLHVQQRAAQKRRGR